MARSPKYSEDSDYDFDEEYFSRTYQPLSNLPTPPPSSKQSLAAQSPRALLEDGGLLDSVLLGPAVHLVNMIPPSASVMEPSVQLVHEMLVRANLPMDVIALAVCILDALNSKFSLNWRLLCPLAKPQQPPSPSGETTTSPSNKRHTLPAAPRGGSSTFVIAPQLHIDAVRPEVIILSALVIAVKFLEDSQSPTHWYASAWGKDMWTCDQINVTERCIMESLGYRIMPLWDATLIADALRDMERAGKQVLNPPRSQRPRSGEVHKRSVSSVETAAAHQQQQKHSHQQQCQRHHHYPQHRQAASGPTPAETPVLAQ
ncbi:uncharacterized protein CTHT_0032400 [Thermochaetoides thermophila DSM 1495]|uniref:Cyclin N-terminal domain-containing protein n=1 Tax=Chaetomium thermophilum (strain DSM 1495 / CBS 144.50 / IMI 039719) TaxID=759272 RepID=G0S564_CHATD|nr:hypothetical protein CTHT_0032400 [Thermochaetoides thermophila DSM 1495]EGS21383.1 hypothetical protein CTHT_0032400 [Thermochaetoides thermophila DSM 1495]